MIINSQSKCLKQMCPASASACSEDHGCLRTPKNFLLLFSATAFTTLKILLSNMKQRHPSNTDANLRLRQDPVSCQFCRRKKLKCNRDRPCSNCLKRGVECELPPRWLDHQGAPDSPQKANHETVFARLKRLEDAVFGSNSKSLPPEEPRPRHPSLPTTSQTSLIETELQEDHNAQASNSWLESLSSSNDSNVCASIVALVSVLTPTASLSF
jgi:hypothetical protein